MTTKLDEKTGEILELPGSDASVAAKIREALEGGLKDLVEAGAVIRSLLRGDQEVNPADPPECGPRDFAKAVAKLVDRAGKAAETASILRLWLRPATSPLPFAEPTSPQRERKD